MQPFNFCQVYSIRILRSSSFKLYRMFLLTKCFVICEKFFWYVLLDCFKLPRKSVFSAHKHARNLALKWLRAEPGLEIRGSNGSKCYHVFSFATGMLMW